MILVNGQSAKKRPVQRLDRKSASVPDVITARQRKSNQPVMIMWTEPAQSVDRLIRIGQIQMILTH